MAGGKEGGEGTGKDERRGREGKGGEDERRGRGGKGGEDERRGRGGKGGRGWRVEFAWISLVLIANRSIKESE